MGAVYFYILQFYPLHHNLDSLDGIVLCHLPEGPTAYFKINSLTFTKALKVLFSNP